MNKAPRIPDSAELRAIRARDNQHVSLQSGAQIVADRRALLALIDDIIEQAHGGIFAEHECPAMFACAYVIANCCEPESSATLIRERSIQMAVKGGATDEIQRLKRELLAEKRASERLARELDKFRAFFVDEQTENALLQERLQDCELSLNIYDRAHSSEYWVRHHPDTHAVGDDRG